MTQGKFKDRFTQHKHSFKNKSKRNATTLSAYVWDKRINTQTDIKWNIIKKWSVYFFFFFDLKPTIYSILKG